jgi:hypothetical protein
MNTPSNHRTALGRPALTLAGLAAPAALWLAALWLAALGPAFAAPGAHGPNGEHLDAPSTLRAASALPRVEASTDTFELVATLQAGELSILIDRYASNEPVLGAQLEVESGGLKAKATFHADLGDYAVDDAKLLALLRTPGEHALVFTLVAGADSDLLDATLLTTAVGIAAGAAGSAHGHGHGHGNADGDGDGAHGHVGDAHAHELERAAWAGAGVAALGLVGGLAWWRQRRRTAFTTQGGL